MICRLLALPFVALITMSACPSAISKDFESINMQDLLAAKMQPLQAPPPQLPNPNNLVAPAGETRTFPIRGDGQPYVLAEDISVNLTQALNSYYFDPKWRGEEWGPFNTYWIVERQARMMPTWHEYDEFSIFRVGNGWHKFWEKYSGYGP
jgi:hypothetical protein